MIPNDRGRSSQGPPRVFGRKSRLFDGVLDLPVRRGVFAFFPKRFLRVGGTSEKKLRFVVNQKSLKAIGGKSQNSAQLSGRFLRAWVFFHFTLFLHTAYYFIRAILILLSITFWTPANLILPSITFWTTPANLDFT